MIHIILALQRGVSGISFGDSVCSMLKRFCKFVIVLLNMVLIGDFERTMFCDIQICGIHLLLVCVFWGGRAKHCKNRGFVVVSSYDRSGAVIG